MFKVFFVEILVYFQGCVMIWRLCYCILSFTLLCSEFGIVKNEVLFGVNFVNLKSWLCKTNDMLPVWLYLQPYDIILIYTSGPGISCDHL